MGTGPRWAFAKHAACVQRTVNTRSTHGQHTVNTMVNTAAFVRKVANIKQDFDSDAGALLKHMSLIVFTWAAGTVELCFAFPAAFS